MLNPFNICYIMRIQLKVPLIYKPPEVSFYSSVVIYMLLILLVGPIGADRGHTASSATVLWEMKDLSLMSHNRSKCNGRKLNSISLELQVMI